MKTFSSRFVLNKILRPITIIFSFLMLFAASPFAQSIAEKGFPYITNYIPETGGNAQAWSAVEDNRGVMYFGMSTITEYDGVKWRKISVPSNIAASVRTLAKDKKGRIFFGTASDFGYLATDSIGQMVTHSLLSNIPVAERNFLDIWTIYPTDEGVFFQSRDKIFRLVENEGNKAKPWTVAAWAPQTKFMYAFYLDNSYYVHQQEKGLYRLVHDSLQLIPGSEFLGNERMQVMLPYTRNNQKQYLIGLFTGGLYLYNGKTFVPFKTEADPIFKNTRIYKAARLKDGSYALLTTGKGVIVINADGRILEKFDANSGLQNESAYGICQDSKGNLWVTLENGISRIAVESPFTQFGAQSGITTTTQSAIRYNGALYIGSANGLLQFDSVKRTFELINQIPKNQIFSMLPDKDQLLVPGEGLAAIKGNKIATLQASVGGNLQMTSAYILKKHPQVLFCGATFGTAVFSRKNTVNWKYIGMLPNLNDQVWSFAEEPDGSIWAGAINAAYLIQPGMNEKGEFDLEKTVSRKFGKADGLGALSNYVSKINGVIYFCGDSVFYRVDKHKRFYKDTTFGVMKTGANTNIVQDSANRFWVQLGTEIKLVTPLPNGKYRFETTPFLPLADRAINGFYPEGNGITWICMADGLIRYDERLKKDYDASYNILLRAVKAGDVFINPDHDTTHATAIKYSQNALRFEYAAPFFDREEKTMYQTFLEGFDHGWSEWAKNSYKEYTNLPEGKYTFRVRAKNVYGKVSNEALYEVTIKPPFYNTVWSYILYALTFSGLVWLFTAYRSKKLRSENKLLEEKVAQRTGQLNKSIEELKATQTQLIQSEKMASLGELTAGIAHEIQNPLNFVNNFSEVNKELIGELQNELKTGNTEEAIVISNDIKNNEEKISYHGKRADAIVKGMLQHSRTGGSQKEPANINALADECLRLSYHGLRAKDKSFQSDIKTDFDKSIGKINIVSSDIARVLINLCNNAFYAVNDRKQKLNGTFEPLVMVSTKSENGNVVLSVKDNGGGVPRHIADKIFQPFFTTKPTGQGTGLGLSLAYDIIKAHGGEIKVETEESEGSAFIVQLPFNP